MGTENNTLRFPDKSTPISREDILAVALETSGHLNKKNLHEIQLDSLRRMFLVLQTNAVEKYHEGDSYFFHDEFVPVRDAALSVAEKKNPYEEIGYHCGWLPETQIDGSFIIEEIRKIPDEKLLIDLDPLIRPYVAICTLNPHSSISVPKGFEYDHVYRVLYVHGASIRTCDTFPDDPDGGEPQSLRLAG